MSHPAFGIPLTSEERTALAIGTTTTRRPSRATVIALALLAGAASFAWYGLRPAGEQELPAASSTVTLAGEPASNGAVRTISRSGLPTRVVIERLGIDAPVTEVGVVVEGGKARWETAWRAAGHHMDSARPGQPGNVVLSGHVSVADRRNLAVFSHLEGAGEGDVVEVFAGDQVYRYAVRNVLVVPPSAVRFLRSDHTSTITLITCTRDLKNRLVVVGTLI